MKKLSQILAMAAIFLAPLVVGNTAFAASTCQVGYTGPDSSNLCTSVTAYTCTATNDNTIAIVTENGQTATSGSVDLTNNNSGGSAGTGNATNNNNVSFNVTVTNKVCSVVATIPATVTPVTPEEPKPVVIVAPSNVTPKALPYTSGNSMSENLGIIAATLGIGAVSICLAVLAYRRQQS